MKTLYTLLLLFAGIPAFATGSTFNKLTEVNKVWAEQPDINTATLPAYTERTETEWIRMHLQLVEATLRKRDTRHLTAAQQRLRLQCLGYLHAYWQTGNFPVNDRYSYRTPIFIDQYDNFCAVGHLIKASGHEHISRMIAATSNLAYVKQMHYPELAEWAVTHGFTTAELAWIQPGYGGSIYMYCSKVGNGVNGPISELYVDDTAEVMYVGGAFTEADGSISAANIASVTELGGTYTWHSLYPGVNGPVYAITKHAGRIYVGGSFDSAGGMPAANIAYWDGSWHAAGCVAGTVYDLAVYNDTLYAGGDFDDCTTAAETNLAKWNGSQWQPMPGISGKVNKLTPIENAFVNYLFIGGAFSHSAANNVVALDASGAFYSFGNNIKNEVTDLTWSESSMMIYAACRQTVDSNILWSTMSGVAWDSAYTYTFCQPPPAPFLPQTGMLALNTLYFNIYNCLEVGGQFRFSGTGANGCYYSSGGFIVTVSSAQVDSAVNKIVRFKHAEILGGRFKYGNGDGNTDVELNSIARRDGLYSILVKGSTSLHSAVAISPNPAAAGTAISLIGALAATRYTLQDMTGRPIATGRLNSTQQVQLPQTPPGLYLITVSNEAGERAVQKIVIE